MFTGIIEEVGRVAAVEPMGSARRIRIGAERVIEGTALGDSISVNGVCLTVTRLGPDFFEAEAVPTTLQRTTLGEFEPGRAVNLERALAFGARLGGHLVQGHVDGVGEIERIERQEDHVLIDVTLPPIVAEVTILHGSVTLDGISLTVNALPGPGILQVSIIPHTWEVTNLVDARVGSRVNLEGDLIARYVRQLTLRSTDADG